MRRPGPKTTPETRAEITRLYESGVRTQQISDRFDINPMLESKDAAVRAQLEATNPQT